MPLTREATIKRPVRARGVAESAGALKDAVKEYKRGMIMESALQLFYENGFRGTSLDALAERLGVTKPFIYTYFDNKNALLTAIYEQILEQLVELIDTALAGPGSPAEQLAALVGRFARQNMQSQTLATVFMQEEKHLDKRLLKRIKLREKDFDRRFAELIQRGMDAGEFQVDNATIAALGMIGMVRWIPRWYHEGQGLSVDEIARLMSRMALNLVRYRAPRPAD